MLSLSLLHKNPLKVLDLGLGLPLLRLHAVLEFVINNLKPLNFLVTKAHLSEDLIQVDVL